MKVVLSIVKHIHLANAMVPEGSLGVGCKDVVVEVIKGIVQK